MNIDQVLQLIKPEMASVNIKAACPESCLPVKFAILVLIVILSPSRKKRGAFGITINSFCVTVVKVFVALSKVLVCANNCSFHFLTNNNIEDAVQCFVESRDIDMIAMVAKNLNYFQRILFMPTVEEISYHSDVPFLVLHEQQN